MASWPLHETPPPRPAALVTSLYDSIGGTYGRSRRADPALCGALARELGLTASGSWLDLACGTGNYTVALASLGGAWAAVDISQVMLAQARGKSGSIGWVRCDASRLPFGDGRFDGALCTLAVHHFKRLDAPFAEVRRTLRPGGAFVLFTGLAEQMRNYWLCHYFPQTMASSIERMPSAATLRTALEAAGFTATRFIPFVVTNELQDLFLYSGKDRPSLYLDAAVRANISSFANLAPPAELADGLERLARDLQAGTFASVKARYPTSGGDYALVVTRS